MELVAPYPKKKRQKKKTITLSFYQREDVVQIAQDLLGKWLCTQLDGKVVTAGMIIETEAYAGVDDRACHAFGNKRTKRTEVMFRDGGIAYIYFCYGMHHLLNVVTHREGTPHAVLIRSIFPTEGIDLMLKRRNKIRLDATLTNGPGTLCQALGLTLKHNALPLTSREIWIEDRGVTLSKEIIAISPRIGIAYAGEDAHLPYRFYIKRRLE